jgi:hypothetical protein
LLLKLRARTLGRVMRLFTAADSLERLFSPKGFALLLAVALAAMYFPVLFGGETFYYRDFGVLAIPVATYHKTSLLAGEIPFWNPYSNCGAPFLAQWGTMVLYPLSLIYVLLPLPWALNFFCIVHLWFGGFGMYLLARRWFGSDWAAVIAGTAFTFNGITQAALAWPNYIAAMAWFPWIILSTERVWSPDRPSARPGRTSTMTGQIIVAAGASAMQLLAGVPELSVFTWLLVTLFWLARLFTMRGAFKPLLVLYVAVAVATAGLTAIQLLPFYELLSNSQRTPGFAAEKWALPIWGWANLVLPRFRTYVTPQGTVFQAGQEFLTSVYIGAPLLILAGASFLRRTRRIWILAIVAILSAVLAFGFAGIVHPVLLKIFPPLGIARYPVKFLFLLAFIVPLLAAAGATAFSEMAEERRRKLLIVSGGVALVLLGILVALDQGFALYFERLTELRWNSMVRAAFAVAMLGAIHFTTGQGHRRQIAQLAFLLLFVADAKAHLQKLNPTITASVFTGNVWSQAQPFPKPVHGMSRIFITPAAEEKFLHSRVADDAKELVGKRLAEWSHLNLLDRVPKANGSSTLQVREQARVQTSLYSGTNRNVEAWLDFLNVRYKTASNSVVEWEQRSSAFPFVTAGQETVTNVDPLIQKLDFQEQVVLTRLESDGRPRARSNVAISDIKISAHEVRFEATAVAPSMAVIAQTWFPSWKATIQRPGQSPTDADVLRANLAFQGVLIPAGQSSVRVFYDDHSFKLGAAIAGSTALLLCLLWITEKKNTLLTNEKSVR